MVKYNQIVLKEWKILYSHVLKSGVKEVEKEEKSSPNNVHQKENIESFIVKTNSNSPHKLDMLIDIFFFSNSIPFNVAEHLVFLELISTLRPGYTPLSRNALSETTFWWNCSRNWGSH